jgi:2-polyprenyl-3-methyl-5-hydroxy-6-metoxy-1,4-benzoquinol methylase
LTDGRSAAEPRPFVPSPERALVRAESEFWDRQEREIDRLYARPHDWRFVPEIADRIVAPRYRFLRRLLVARRGEIRRVLDVGCGNGWFLHAAAELGFEGVGIDVAELKIEAAKRAAAERGISSRCEFRVEDVLEYAPERRFDLLVSQGSLHHLPGLEAKLPELVARLVRPGGYMLLSEPHFEGTAPWLERFIWRLANHPRHGRHFDLEFYREVSEAVSATTAGSAREAAAPDVRGESPAGQAFLHEHVPMREIVARYPILAERYFLVLSGPLANAFHVYMKSRAVRALFRATLPIWIGVDTTLGRFERFHRHAQEGVWFARVDGGGDAQGRGGAGVRT